MARNLRAASTQHASHWGVNVHSRNLLLLRCFCLGLREKEREREREREVIKRNKISPFCSYAVFVAFYVGDTCCYRHRTDTIGFLRKRIVKRSFTSSITTQPLIARWLAVWQLAAARFRRTAHYSNRKGCGVQKLDGDGGWEDHLYYKKYNIRNTTWCITMINNKLRKLRIHYLRSQIENEIFLYAKFFTHASLKNTYKSDYCSVNVNINRDNCALTFSFY